jgi:hypothetical protein
LKTGARGGGLRRKHIVVFETYVLAVGIKVVVDSVEEGVAGDLGGTAGRVVDIVTLEGDHVVAAGEVDQEVVLGIFFSVSILVGLT